MKRYRSTAVTFGKCTALNIVHEFSPLTAKAVPLPSHAHNTQISNAVLSNMMLILLRRQCVLHHRRTNHPRIWLYPRNRGLRRLGSEMKSYRSTAVTFGKCTARNIIHEYIQSSACLATLTNCRSPLTYSCVLCRGQIKFLLQWRMSASCSGHGSGVKVPY